MSIQVSLPEVGALREKVTEKVGITLNTHNQFLTLVKEIEQTLHEHISESTLERIWGYSTRQHEWISQRSLDVLSRYVGYQSWADFCKRLRAEAGVESAMFREGLLSSKDLQVGDRLRIGWQPDRVCIVRYLGDNRFVAEETLHSSMRPGDSFSCLQFQKGHPLYLDDFRRGAEEGSVENSRYVVGQEHGLMILEILKDFRTGSRAELS